MHFQKLWPSVPALLLTVAGQVQTSSCQQFTAAKNVSPSANVGGALAVGDINHDGKLDILSYDQSAASYVVLLGNGKGTFTEKVPTTAIHGGYGGLGDLNGDGYLDLVTIYPGNTDNDGAGIEYGQMKVYLGDASGDFHLAFSANVGAGYASLGLGDVNGDGRLDIITDTGVYKEQGNVQVFLNKGNATFQEHPGGQAIGVLAVGDLNGDGKADFVGSNGGNVEALLSNGDGSFRVSYSSPAGIVDNSDPVVIADFNKDGHKDFVVFDQVFGNTILQGKGDGTFTIKGRFKTASNDYPGWPYGPRTLSAVGADFNHDGIIDLVTFNLADFTSPSNVTPSSGDFAFVSVNLGKGDGTFQVATNYSVAPGTGGAVTGDFNGDGNQDVIAGTFPSGYPAAKSFLQLLPGTASGALQAPVNTLSADPFSIVHADFNHDGIQDVAVVNQGCSGCNATVSVFLGSGKGYFNAPKTYSIGLAIGSIAAGDINRDGKVDLVVARAGQVYIPPAMATAAAASPSSDDISVLLGNGDGTFKPAVNSVLLGPAGTSHSTWLVDMNRDGKLDLVGDWGVALGRGDGTFKPPIPFPSNILSLDGVGVGDFNNDGIQDVVIWAAQQGQIETMLGDGTGAFKPKSTFSYPHYVITDLQVAKMYGGAERDLVFCGESVDTASAELSTNLVATVHGNGDGTFGTKKIVPLPTLPRSLAYADFDRDGKLDVVVNDSFGVQYLRGTGTGSFYAPQFFPGTPTLLQAIDVNGDGALDVVGITPIGFERLMNTGKKD